MTVGKRGAWQIYSIFYVFVVACLLISTSSFAHAQTPSTETPQEQFQGCQDLPLVQSSGILKAIPSDTYSVYVQLAKRGQQATVSVHAGGKEAGDCAAIGSTQATGDGWTKVGTWNSGTEATRDAQFILETDQFDGTLDANRPTVMLLSETHPTCTPNPACQVSIGGRLGTILPPGNSIATDSLRVTRVISPDADTVTKVLHYVDDRPVYTSKTLETFDYRYLIASQQRATSVVEYASGQRISLNEEVPLTYSDNFFNFLFRVFQTSPQLITSFAVAIGLWILAAITLAIVHTIERRHNWRLAHGFIKPHAYKAGAPVSVSRIFKIEHIKEIIRACLKYGAILISMVVVGVAVNQYVGTFYTIHGTSMTNTFSNNGKVIINRIPVTVAALAGRDYIPERGQVVILNAAYGFVNPQSAKDANEGYIIKRVLGLPGERVNIKDGVVTIYKSDGSSILPDTDAPWQNTMIPSTSAENIDLTLNNNELFVSGDNRIGSVDSRFNGPITTDQLVGIVTIKLW